MKILSQFYSFSGFVTIYFFLLVSLVFHTLASPTFERNALLEFKNDFPKNREPGPYDITNQYLSLWNTSSDHCSWSGVTCDDKSGEVISLFLSYIHLNGSLKSNSSLFKLQHLRGLNLINCGLIAEIPSSLGNLSRLTELWLKDNHLVGEVPASIGNLNQLALLSLSSNNLTGNIPISFANFNKLSDLDLSNNQFTSGDFSRILPNLTSLSSLVLRQNHFKSKLPADMSGLQNLKYLFASGNSFFGNVPTSLFTIPSLRMVDLRENQFEGPLEFGETSFKLLDLDLAHNNLIGTIPESISQLVNLSSLDLSHNNIIGTIPRSMFKLASLESLDLSYNKLEGQVPSFLWNVYWVRLSHNSFSSLENSMEGIFDVGVFELGSNSLQGLLPQCICNSTRLRLLDVSNNHLTGSIPSCLKNATASVRFMILRNNNFTGVIPDIFIDSTELLSLDLSRNQLDGKLPKSLMNCSSLRFLNVKGNKIKDTFPYWLNSLEFLRLLLLGSNAFYGPIYSSPAYFGFPTLRVIDISHNSFNGTLPRDYFANWLEIMSSVVWIEGEERSGRFEWFGSASPYSGRGIHRDSMDMMYKGVDTNFSLIYLGYKAIDFSGNKFQGRIPKSIGMLKDLRLLNLSGNAFTGNIPSSLANITNLEALDLSRNKLSGQIPHDLGNLSFLSYLDFSHNLLQGPVPRSTQFQRQNCSSFEDNLGLSGLEDICRVFHVPDATLQLPEDFSSEPEQVLNWIAAAIAYVPGVFCGLVIGHIFTSHKREWFMEKFGRNKPRGI